MYEQAGRTALEYYPCRYGTSRLTFRGPAAALEGAYCAVLGGSETYGKFVAHPYTDLVASATGLHVVNLGYVNAGVDAFWADAGLAPVLQGARAVLVQAMGAHNMSNRFYTVHPRRNDRFVRAAQPLKALFPEVDFTEFHFTRHMLLRLRSESADRFALVVEELRAAWLARMKSLVQRLPQRRGLLVLRRPGDALGPAPLYVTPEMIARLRPLFTEVMTVTPSQQAEATGTEGMVFSPLDLPAAEELPGPAIHVELADQLAPMLMRLMAGGDQRGAA